MPGQSDQPSGVTLTAQQQRSRRVRNIAIGVAVGALVVLFYVITIVKLGSRVLTGFDGS